MRTPKWLGSFIIFSVGFLAIMYWQGRDQHLGPQPSRVEDFSPTRPKPAPYFELPSTTGKNVSTDDLKGKITLVHFWATWCPPCITELPRWAKLAKIFKDRPVQLVAISLDDSWEEANRELPPEKLPSNLYSLLDLEGGLPDAFGTFQFPETYLLNEKAEIIAKWIGLQEWDHPKMIEFISSTIPKKQ